MKKQISSFAKELRAAKKYQILEEASIKQGVVLRLLSYLGWDIFNVEEVSPDLISGGITISYGLFIDSACKILVNVKSGRETPDEHQPQVVTAAGHEGVELAVHTDGRRWIFFLTSAKGGWKDKRCHEIDLADRKPEQAASEFISLLSRENAAGGEYLEAARAAHLEQRHQLAVGVLPEAWNRMLAAPDKVLMELLNNLAEKICGHRADPRAVESFIRTHLPKWRLAEPGGFPATAPEANAPATVSTAPAAPTATIPDIRAKRPESFADKPIKSFSLKGSTFPVRSWEEMLTTLCNHMALSHAHEFEKVLWMYDDDRHCFSRYADQLRIPEKIKKTNIYVETKLAPDDILKTVGDLLTEFGYGHNELVITTQ
jgi:hypothetical protein